MNLTQINVKSPVLVVQSSILDEVKGISFPSEIVHLSWKRKEFHVFGGRI